MHKKLFIPGPVEVYPDRLKQLSKPQVGHRSSDYSKVHKQVRELAQKLFHTQNKVFVSTSSGTGVMEATIRNCAKDRVLSCICGAFTKRWNQIANLCGKANDVINVEWGNAIKPEMIDEKLATGKYDMLTIAHNETSTGVMHNLYEIADVMKKYPEVVWGLDTVSSMGGVKIEVDKLGVDVCLTSTQKALALPPGAALFSVSEKAFQRSKEVEGKGFYFNFESFLKYYEKDQTPATPVIPLVYALEYQLNKIVNEEGLENRYNRHKMMADTCRNWAVEHGFELFAEDGYQSNTLTCIKNNKGISIAELNKKLGEQGFMISNGYGDMKEKNFRIAHMGDTQPNELMELLNTIEKLI